MDQGRTIRIPVHMIETINKQFQAVGSLRQEMGREPTPEEIAGKTGVPVSKVQTALQVAQEPLSLDTPLGEEEDLRLGDFIEDESVVDSVESLITSRLREAAEEALGHLTPREEKVLRMRFGIGPNGQEHTLEEVGHRFIVTRERIRQIEEPFNLSPSF